MLDVNCGSVGIYAMLCNTEKFTVDIHQGKRRTASVVANLENGYPFIRFFFLEINWRTSTSFRTGFLLMRNRRQTRRRVSQETLDILQRRYKYFHKGV
jgi:hypothetical protein